MTIRVRAAVPDDVDAIRRTLERLNARGWQRLDQPVRLAKPERLWLALRYGLL